MASEEVAISKPVKEAPKVGAISLSDEEQNRYSVNWKFGSWATDTSNAGRLNFVDCIWEMIFDKFNPEVKNQNYDTCQGLPMYGDYEWTSHNTDPVNRPWGTRKLWVGCQPEVEEDEFIIHKERMYPFGERYQKNNEWYVDWEGSTGRKEDGKSIQSGFMKLLRLRVRVYGTNPKTGGQMNRGPGGYSPWWNFSPPDSPILSDPQMASGSGSNVSPNITFTTSAGENKVRYVLTSGQPTTDSKAVRNDGGQNVGLIYEKKRYATRYNVYRWAKYADGTGDNKWVLIERDTDTRRIVDISAVPGGSAGYRAVNGLCTSEENTITVNNAISEIMDSSKFRYGAYIDIMVKAWDVGCGGPSTVVQSSHRFCYPGRVSITEIKIDNPNDPYEIYININTDETDKLHANDFILERVANSTAETAADIPAGTSWTTAATISVTDDSLGAGWVPSGFVDIYSSTGQTERGTHLWYRVRTVRDGVWTTYGKPFEAKALYKAPITAEGSTMEIVSAESNDSTSVALVLGWPAEADPLTGTELSWSEYEDAWYSTQQPSTYNATWREDPPSGFSYPNYAKVVIRGLQEGVPYYMKARRYYDPASGTGATSYGKYAYPPEAAYPITPVSMPENVYLTAPEYWPKGKAFEVLWTYDSEADQTEWVLYSGSEQKANGNDARGATVYEPAADEESVTLSVSMSTGSAWTSSDAVTVVLVDPPVCTLTVPETLTTQPLSFEVASTVNGCELALSIVSEGYFYHGPDGNVSLSQGEVVWTDYNTSPTWEESEDVYTTGVTVDHIDRFYDKGSYIVLATLYDPVTGLYSEQVSQEFSVNWSHQAILAGIRTWIQTYPDDKTVTIHLFGAEGMTEDDVADIYRSTPDGYQRIATGIPFGIDVIDRFAPYSNDGMLEYRIQTRTADGDTDWVDIPYKIYGYAVRFDWGSEDYLELPYNLGIDDSYAKDAEIRRHLDGGNGLYFNPGVEREISLSAATIKRGDPDIYERLRALGRFNGPVYVRLPNGCAFQANVTVDGINRPYDALVSDISIRIQEVSTTSVFMVSEEDILYPTEDTVENSGSGA